MLESSTNSFELPFFEVRLDFFDGPIDLLLHLVKQRELPIEKISLALVADQYVSCIEHFENLDLEQAAEYLVLATTLLSIKAAVLLHGPEPEAALGEDGPDPHEELLRKLREAAIYRDGAQLLGSRNMLGVDVFRTSSSIEQFDDRPDNEDLRFDSILLGKAFEKLLSRTGKSNREIEIFVDSVTVMERMVTILDLLQNAQRKHPSNSMSFRSLVGQVAEVQARAQVISAFLALLELCKRRVIRISQGPVKGSVVSASRSSPEHLISETSTHNVLPHVAEQGADQAKITSELEEQDGEIFISLSGVEISTQELDSEFDRPAQINEAI